MIIGVSDIDKWNFSEQLIKHWESQGHEIRKSMYHETDFINQCDVVWYDFASINVVELGKEQQKPKAKIIVRAIDIENYMNYCDGFNFDYIDHYIFLNNKQKEMMQAHPGFKMPEEKIHVIPMGVDLDKFTLKKTKPGKKAVFVGRLWIGKNVVGAIDLIYELKKTCPKWTLHIRGDRYDPRWWKKYADHRIKELGVEVVYDQRVDDMNEYLEDKDLMIMPSFKEAFSYVTCEALAKGIPTVINNWYGAKDIWPEEFIYNTPSEGARLADVLTAREPEYFRKFAYDEKDMFKKIDALL